MSQGMKAEGLENVRLQPVQVPHWVRGNESAADMTPLDSNYEVDYRCSLLNRN